MVSHNVVMMVVTIASHAAVGGETMEVRALGGLRKGQPRDSLRSFRHST